MMNSKLISYITSDFQSQSDIKIGQIEWKKLWMNDLTNLKKLVQSGKRLLKYGIKKVH